MGKPYATLNPDLVLDAIESTGMRVDGRLLTLNSFENRVYQVGIDDAPPVIVKFYRPHRWSDAAILEEHTFLQELGDAEIPAVAPLVLPLGDAAGTTLSTYNGFRFSVFPRRGGRPPELEQSDTLEWLGRFIGRIHQVGARKPYAERGVIDLPTYGTAPRDYLRDSGVVPENLREAYFAIVDLALAAIARGYERAGDIALLRLHGDCHPGNVLWTDAGPHFVDFDDSRMGPAVQDLWMLLPGDRDGQRRALGDVLAGYEDFCEFDQRSLYLIEPLRTLRLIHYSAWLARRWDDPAFPAAFPWFNTQRYWEERILELREQVALMDEEPLWPI
ncbi:serine/threonine protein kinase [Robbsia sp. KACC 23696]|uniref:serine/threonine protein kinase n=1 Tax=Robbsia sp. KACC 23696 TaxID=3149231 RepID=UPI00325B0346